MQRLYDVLHLYGITLNHSKSILSVTELRMLGYLISYMTVKPDPERMLPLLSLPVPTDNKSLQRAKGLFAYYSKWIKKFSEKIHHFSNPNFPLSKEAIDTFNELKEEIASGSIACPNNVDPLIVESDASDQALSASLTQNGRPVAFFSRTLQRHEVKHPPIEKEAAAIIEACRKWRHYLSGRHFLLITDQEAVSFIFNKSKHGTTKNDKILCWRVEMSCLDFDIKYRPGPQNVVADCLTRAVCSSTMPTLDKLKALHNDLCHPGMSRLTHFVRTRNLPYSTEDIKQVTSHCRVCAELKPNFFRPENPPLIKATQPFERLGIDFKGPLPSSTQNRYLLTIIDEYSRFPFAYACPNMSAGVIIKHLNNLFSVFGITGYIHSDNGPSLISDELRKHLVKNGIAYSNSTRYNPKGNGQVERYNKTIWKAIQLYLKNQNLDIKYWEHALPSALNSVRSLLCTSTNVTPHERLFSFSRRTTAGHTLPSWLLNSDSALLKMHARTSKYETEVEEVDIIEVNPTYVHVKNSSGTEMTVSLRDLAPLPPTEKGSISSPDTASPPKSDSPIPLDSNLSPPVPPPASTEDSTTAPENALTPPSGSLVEGVCRRYPVRDRKQTDFYQSSM